jgi:hypothetical protein
LFGIEEYTKKVEIWKSGASSLWSEHEELWEGNMFVEQQKGGGTMAGYGEWMKGTTNRKHGETDEEGEVV